MRAVSVRKSARMLVVRDRENNGDIWRFIGDVGRYNQALGSGEIYRAIIENRKI